MSSTTSHLVVYDAVVTALQATPALTDGGIKTMRDTNRPMDADVKSQIRVFLDRSDPAPLVGGSAPVDWTTRVRIECLSRDILAEAASRTVVLKSFDASSLLAANAQKRILESATLASLIIQIEPGPMGWSEDEADTNLSACQCLFTLTHRTPFANLIV